jgi:hypothetical protein
MGLRSLFILYGALKYRQVLSGHRGLQFELDHQIIVSVLGKPNENRDNNNN